MKKIIYTCPINGNLCVVNPAPKANIEKNLGPLTEKEYVDHVISRSIPQGVSYKFIEDTDIPSSREFRDAWVDVLEGSQIDICCEKAKAIKLVQMRSLRNKKLEETDKLFIEKLSKGEDTNNLVLEKQRLRDITNDLKSLDVTGKVNDESILKSIKELSELI